MKDGQFWKGILGKNKGLGLGRLLWGMGILLMLFAALPRGAYAAEPEDPILICISYEDDEPKGFAPGIPVSTTNASMLLSDPDLYADGYTYQAYFSDTSAPVVWGASIADVGMFVFSPDTDVSARCFTGNAVQIGEQVSILYADEEWELMRLDGITVTGYGEPQDGYATLLLSDIDEAKAKMQYPAAVVNGAGELVGFVSAGNNGTVYAWYVPEEEEQETTEGQEDPESSAAAPTRADRRKDETDEPETSEAESQEETAEEDGDGKESTEGVSEPDGQEKPDETEASEKAEDEGGNKESGKERELPSTPDSNTDKEDGGNHFGLILGIAAVLVALAAIVLVRRKKSGKRKIQDDGQRKQPGGGINVPTEAGAGNGEAADYPDKTMPAAPATEAVPKAAIDQLSNLQWEDVPTEAQREDTPTEKAEESTGVELYMEGIGGELNGLQYPIKEGETVIGRGPEAAIRYAADSKGISRVHCKIFWQNHVLMVMDTSSTGTYRQGSGRLPKEVPVPLVHGDIIYIGSKKNALKFCARKKG